MRLLIVSLDAYSLFFPETKFPFGGAEVRASIFARHLARDPDLHVTLMTLDQGTSDRQVDGVHVVSHPEKKGEGYWEAYRKPMKRIARVLSVRVDDTSTLEERLDALSPDAVLILGMSPTAVQLATYCRLQLKRFLFGCASDLDLSEHYRRGSTIEKDISGNDSTAYYTVFESSQAIFCQTPEQKHLLKERFGKDGVLLLNPIEIPVDSAVDERKEFDTLWIGKRNAIKRPELFLAMMAEQRHLKGLMILNGGIGGLSVPQNVQVIERVPFAETLNYFRRSRVFVNTSSVEGFANTFLQAAACGVPMISTGCDPNQMLSHYGAGVISSEDPGMIGRHISQLLADEQWYAQMSSAGLAYVRRFHDAQAVSEQLRKFITA